MGMCARAFPGRASAQYQKCDENPHPTNPAKHMLSFAYHHAYHPSHKTYVCFGSPASGHNPWKVVAKRPDARTECGHASNFGPLNSDAARRGRRFGAVECLDACARLYRAGTAGEALEYK